MNIFRAHVNQHASDYELVRPIRCCQGACKATFDKPFNFFRHLNQFHAEDHVHDTSQVLMASVAPGMVRNVGCDCPSGSGDVLEACANSDYAEADCTLKTVQHEETLLVASLRANSSIPYGVIPNITDSVNEISNSLLAACQAEAVHCFSETVQELDSNNLVKNFQDKLSNSLNQL